VQARIDGMTPAALALLTVHIEKIQGTRRGMTAGPAHSLALSAIVDRARAAGIDLSKSAATRLASHARAVLDANDRLQSHGDHAGRGVFSSDISGKHSRVRPYFPQKSAACFSISEVATDIPESHLPSCDLDWCRFSQKHP
jgi:hypothetical protein